MSNKTTININLGEDTKTFADLQKEVIEKSICGSCRGCVSFCSAGDLGALTLKDEKPTYFDENKCLKCGICYLICPNIKELDDKLKTRFNWTPPFGFYKDIYSARTTDQKIARVCTDGGVVTSILAYMIDTKMIDGALVAQSTGLWSHEPLLATSIRELISAAGLRLTHVANIESLEKYTTYSPTLIGLRRLKAAEDLRIAVVGTPCQIETIRKMQLLKIIPSHTVRFIIGLFCTENFVFDKEGRKQLEKIAGVKTKDIVKLNIKEKLRLTLKTDDMVEVDLDVLDHLARPACLACMNFANDYADISCGGLGSKDGYTTVLTRTAIGKKVVNSVFRSGAIIEDPLRLEEKNNIISLIAQHAAKKRKRGLRVRKEKGVE